jgi:phosphoribosylaminoimidazole-succinocarboxamide synthase
MGFKEQLPFVVERITERDFPNLKSISKFPDVRFYHGKVRDSLCVGPYRYLIATDRLSAFDQNLTTVPFKGEILNTVSTYWLKNVTEQLSVPTHFVTVIDPQVTLVREAKSLPIEMVARAFLVGSAYRSYLKYGSISGIKLPPGLQEFSPLPEIIITPTTKGVVGEHDESISRETILEEKIISEKVYDEMETLTLKLFSYGVKECSKRGLTLVDTKYEFGLLNDSVILIDEIHTLDSSRFWESNSMGLSTPPIMLDKEPFRIWLSERGFMGNGTIPSITDDYRLTLSEHYYESAKKIIGEENLKLHFGQVVERVIYNVSQSLKDL